MNCDQIVINRYLDSRASTLWSRAFDIHSKEGRDEAAKFIERLLHDLDEHFAQYVEEL